MIPNLQDIILNSRLFKTFSVDDLLFVEYKCLVDDHQAAIWTHHNYFAYVLGGQKMWITPEGNYHVSSGEALFVQKGANTVYQYFDEPFFVLFIFLPDEFIKKILAKYPEVIPTQVKNDQSEDAIIKLSNNEVLISFFDSLFSYFLQTKPPHPSLLKLKLEELILNILTQTDNQTLRHCLLRLGQSPKVDLETIMKNHYTYPLMIKDYARLCARSLSTFRRDFKAIFNTTPAKWLIEQRLNYGKFLLETTTKSINEIIDESGFKNRSHFMKVFKEKFGVPPNQFRQKAVVLS